MINAGNNNLDLVQEALGLYGKFPVYVLNDATPRPNREQYYTNEITGAPVWDRITLRNIDANNPPRNDLNYVDEDGVFNTMPSFTFDDYVLIETSTQRKDFIGYKNAGVNGTVKEEVSLDDIEITIRGAIINYENNDFPKIATQRLRGIFKRPLECGVDSKYLNQVLKVYHLFFTENSLTLLPGYGNMQPFELRALSDEPVVFQLLKK